MKLIVKKLLAGRLRRLNNTLKMNKKEFKRFDTVEVTFVTIHPTLKHKGFLQTLWRANKFHYGNVTFLMPSGAKLQNTFMTYSTCTVHTCKMVLLEKFIMNDKNIISTPMNIMEL